MESKPEPQEAVASQAVAHINLKVGPGHSFWDALFVVCR
jgi:hypothetical protein